MKVCVKLSSTVFVNVRAYRLSRDSIAMGLWLGSQYEIKATR